MTSQPSLTHGMLQDFVGQSSGVMHAPSPVNTAMIAHWRSALGDKNPAYHDEAFAKATMHKGVIVPPAMLQVWTMPDLGAPVRSDDAISKLYALLDQNGYTGIAATNSEQEYLAPVCLGDVLKSEKTITDISAEKNTKLGQGFFITSTISFTNQNGVEVGRQLHRVFKFRGAAKSEQPTALRPRPNVTLDTAFYFEAAKNHKFMIQGCDSCNTLQHPPTAVCSTCGSLSLSPREVSGRGEIFSYTIVHAPVSPPFVSPYPVILVLLEEGVRVVSELHGVAVEDVKIGMPVQVDFLDCDPGLSLPIFRKREAA